jgi:hypothetical protein
VASGARDLIFRFLSQTDRFNLAQPADDLDQLADSAKGAGERLEDLERVDPNLDRTGAAARDAGGDLDKLGDDAKHAGDNLDRFGDDAKSAARRVDAAMDAIAKSSKRASDDVRDDMHKAGQGLDDFKDEASSSGREAAASFSGEFSDVTDIVQEIGANAFAGFGPVGAAAGLAAAAGIGVLVAQMQEAQERIKSVREELRGLGLSADTTELDRYTTAFETLASNDDLTQLRSSVESAGVAWQDYITAVVTGGPDVDRIKDKLRALGSTGGGLAGVWDDNVQGAQAAYDALDQYRQGAQGAAGDVDAMRPKLDELAAAQQRAADAAAALQAAQDAARTALAGVADATPALTGVIQTEAQKQADATKTTADSWTDYADTVKLSAADVIGVLDEQTRAAEDFRDNLLEVQKRGDSAFLEWVAQQPPAVAAAYADGTAQQRGAIYAAFQRNVGAQAALGTARGMDDRAPDVGAAADRVHAAAERALKVPVNIPVGLDPPARAAVQSVVGAVRSAIGTLSVPVRPIVGEVYMPSPVARRYVP